eukprot:TRINITY_DN6296_c0_g2_i4.p1 TRINITY_DN6296_c0_g2~~TRINITY_DN6296_c0_g2_i4.p1  ORF type:complete len:125 (-),score=17.38 TRINITY_DN6296_c0_g2_i4:219-557(-)
MEVVEPQDLKGGDYKDKWIEQVRLCKYLSESDLKKLCELVGFTAIFFKPPGERTLIRGIERTTSIFTRHHMWGYSWSILRLDRTFENRWGSSFNQLYFHGNWGCRLVDDAVG